MVEAQNHMHHSCCLMGFDWSSYRSIEFKAENFPVFDALLIVFLSPWWKKYHLTSPPVPHINSHHRFFKVPRFSWTILYPKSATLLISSGKFLSLQLVDLTEILHMLKTGVFSQLRIPTKCRESEFQSQRSRTHHLQKMLFGGTFIGKRYSWIIIIIIITIIIIIIIIIITIILIITIIQKLYSLHTP